MRKTFIRRPGRRLSVLCALNYVQDPCFATSLQFIVLVDNYLLHIFQANDIVADEIFILQQIGTVNQQLHHKF